MFAGGLYLIVNVPSAGQTATTAQCAVDNGGCPSAMQCLEGATQVFCGYCPAGYVQVGDTCQDVDECAIDNGGCGTGQCANTAGAWLCDAACPPGFTGTPETGCVDVNECRVENGGCDWLTQCSNTPGYRECGPCPPDHLGSGTLGCIDVNDCPPEGCQIGDFVAPVLTGPEASVEVAGMVPQGAVARFMVTAVDNVDGRIPVSCSPAAGDVFPPGTTEVTCAATDTAGNAATLTFDVVVR